LADALMEDYRTAPVEPEVKQLLSFAEKMARDASQVTHGDIETLRAAGFSDRAILDAAHVTGFFSYMNRVVQALGADRSSRSV
jgi:uncharacterized peroxidase-related enzyme